MYNSKFKIQNLIYFPLKSLNLTMLSPNFPELYPKNPQTSQN